jgi:hypothetical protein
MLILLQHDVVDIFCDIKGMGFLSNLALLGGVTLVSALVFLFPLRNVALEKYRK